ncbi:MAG: VWA domain-containing protein [bacterium]|nr:VWA domain-containing protein [bacterium]
MIGSAGVLALLHLLRVRPRQVRVITTLFWAQAMEHSRARRLLHRFRHLQTYALLLLLCALLSLALGRPELTGPSADRVWQVIVIDAGASMAAAEPPSGETRLDAARRAVLDEAERLSMGDHLAVIVADPWPRMLHRIEDPRALLAQRLASLVPADQPAAPAAALQLARSLLDGRENPRLVLVTDRAAPAADGSAPEAAAERRVVVVGEPVDNTALLWAMFAPDGDDPLVGRLVVRVGHWGRRPGAVTLRVERAGGAPLLETDAVIEPGATADFVVPGLAADGDGLVVHLKTGDALATDDEAVFRLPLRRPIRVCLDDRTSVPLRLLLEADSSIRTVDRTEGFDLAVVVGSPSPPDRGPRVVVATVGPEIEPGQQVRPVDTSALVGDLSFEGAATGTGVGIDPETPLLDPLLVTDDALLAAWCSADDGPYLTLGSALLADDAGTGHRAALAVMVIRAVRRLAAWDADPVVLAPERTIVDPLWAQRRGHSGEVSVMPASRRSGDLSQAAEVRPDLPTHGGRRLTAPALFEMILLAATACFLLEAVLHSRGRIS